MKEGKRTLVGAQLTHIEALDTYTVDNVYREKGCDGLDGLVIQRGFSIVPQSPVECIVNALSDVYAPRITKIWRWRNRLTERWYFQMEKGVTPTFVFLNEQWKVWAEW